MITTILDPTGVPYRETRFTRPPAGTYAVFMDDVEPDGPDGQASIWLHSVTIEVYEQKPDDVTEKAIEDSITAAGLQWRKQARYWLQTEQRYQVIYEFEYIEKRRI